MGRIASMTTKIFLPPRNHLKAVLAAGIIIVAGVILGLIEIVHIQEMSSTIGIAVFALLPFLINLVLIGAGIFLWRSQFEGKEMLRVAGWVVLGMVVMGLLATWTITHQNIRGHPFDHTQFVTVNNLSAGGLVGFVIGWYDALSSRYQNEVETERARLEFLHSSLRHNVLNGLNIILGNAELIEDRDEDVNNDQLEEIRHRGEDLVRFTEATNALMENFLGRPDMITRPINLSDTLMEEVEAAREQYKQAEFSLDVPEDLYIEGDDFISELVGNLLSNAVEHNDKPTPKVSITACRFDDTVRVQVADNGPGIPGEKKERMLEWNVKGAESSGTGLGLPIANTVVDRYGGSLWIDDNEPRGTEVKVELPVASPSDGTPSND